MSLREPQTGRSSAWSLTSLGLAIILCGQPFAWALRGELGFDENPVFPAAAVLLGLLLLLPESRIWQGRVQCDPTLMAIPLILLCLPIVLLALPYGAIFAQMLFYALFLAGVTFVLAFLPSWTFEYLPRATAVTGGLACLIPYVQLAVSGVPAGFVRLTITGNDNTLMLAEIGTFTAFAALLGPYQSPRPSFRAGVFAGLLFMLGTSTVLLTNTRSAMITIVLCLLLYLTVLKIASPGAGTLRRSQWRNRAGFIATLSACSAAAIVGITALFSPQILSKMLYTFGYRVSGAVAFLSGSETGVVDASSSQRAQQIGETWTGLTASGQGFMAQTVTRGDWFFPHLTFLHAFYDLGALGALLYALIVLFIPGAFCVLAVMHRPIRPYQALIVMLFIWAQIDNLTHGTPYAWRALVPVLFVYTILARDAIPRRVGVVRPACSK